MVSLSQWQVPWLHSQNMFLTVTKFFVTFYMCTALEFWSAMHICYPNSSFNNSAYEIVKSQPTLIFTAIPTFSNTINPSTSYWMGALNAFYNTSEKTNHIKNRERHLLYLLIQFFSIIEILIINIWWGMLMCMKYWNDYER